MDAKDQLKRLLRIQDLAFGIAQADEIVQRAPERIEEIENRFRERNAEYVAIRERHDALDQDKRMRSAELDQLELNRKKFMDDLMQVKSQREYAAMLKEIDSVKAQISDHEEAILTDMEEIEKLSEELTTHEEHINKEREAVGTERADVESEAEAARLEVETGREERNAVQVELPRDVIAAIGRLERSRHGIFLAKAENATCQSCFVRIRPQVFQEIKLATVVHSCDNCRRFLYYEPVLVEPKAEAEAEAEAEAATETGTPDDVGVIDGGAV